MASGTRHRSIKWELAKKLRIGAYKIAIFKKIFDMSISRGGPDAQ